MIRNITIIAIKAKFIKISTDIKGKRRKFPVSGSQKVGSKSSFEALYKKLPHPIQTLSVTNKIDLKKSVSSFLDILLNDLLRKRNTKKMLNSKIIMIKTNSKLIKILCKNLHSTPLFYSQVKPSDHFHLLGSIGQA